MYKTCINEVNPLLLPYQGHCSHISHVGIDRICIYTSITAVVPLVKEIAVYV